MELIKEFVKTHMSTVFFGYKLKGPVVRATWLRSICYESHYTMFPYASTCSGFRGEAGEKNHKGNKRH